MKDLEDVEIALTGKKETEYIHFFMPVDPYLKYEDPDIYTEFDYSKNSEDYLNE